MPNEIHISMQVLNSMCQTVDGLLTVGFGPNGRSTLMTTSTGQVLITNVGSSILQALNISHPVGRMITESIQKHHSFTGDGSKTFACILAGILDNLFHCSVDRQSHGNVPAQQRISLAAGFHLLRSCIIPKIITSDVKENAHFLDLSADVSVTRTALINLVETSLSGKQRKLVRSHLAQILVQFICSEINDDFSGFSEVLDLCIDNFRMLCIEVDGQLPSSTSILDGIIIQRDFVHYNNTVATCQRVAFVLLDYSVERDDSSKATKSTFVIRDDTSLNAALNWKPQHCKLLVDQLQNLGVQVVFARRCLGDVLSGTCLTAGISVVQYVDQEDMERLASTFSINIIGTPAEMFDKDAGNLIVGITKQCERRIIGQKRFVYIEGPRRQSRSVCPARQLIICGMSPGACQQLRLDLLNSLKVLRLYAANDAGQFYHNLDIQTGAGCHAVSLPSGATFELIVYKALGKLLRRDISSEIALNGEPLRLCCLALQAGLLSVPIRLLKNSCLPGHANAVTVEELLRSGDQEDRLVVCGIDGVSGGRLLNTDSIIEPVAGKLLLLEHVLALTEQLLRIDTLLSIRKLPHKVITATVDSDSEDESS